MLKQHKFMKKLKEKEKMSDDKKTLNQIKYWQKNGRFYF